MYWSRSTDLPLATLAFLRVPDCGHKKYGRVLHGICPLSSRASPAAARALPTPAKNDMSKLISISKFYVDSMDI